MDTATDEVLETAGRAPGTVRREVLARARASEEGRRMVFQLSDWSIFACFACSIPDAMAVMRDERGNSVSAKPVGEFRFKPRPFSEDLETLWEESTFLSHTVNAQFAIAAVLEQDANAHAKAAFPEPYGGLVRPSFSVQPYAGPGGGFIATAGGCSFVGTAAEVGRACRSYVSSRGGS